MTHSPGPFGPSAHAVRVLLPALLAAAVLGLTGGDGFVTAIELSSADVVVVTTSSVDQAQPETTQAQPQTQVAGISVERPAVQAPVASTPPTTPPAPTTLPAPTTVVAPSTTIEQDLRTRVLAEISFPWEDRLAGWRIEFLPERTGYRGSTFPKERLIQIYRRDGLSFADYVHVTAHEIGHAVDVTLLDDSDRERWNVARGRDADAGWWVASGADDFSSGAGDWAESFAWSQQPSGDFYSKIGPVPTDEQLTVLADIVG